MKTADDAEDRGAGGRFGAGPFLSRLPARSPLRAITVIGAATA